MKDLIACCGLDCEKCDARIAALNDDNDLREKTAQLWSKLNNAPITAEMINCMGCRTDGVKTPYCDSMCEIRKCVLNRGFATCENCSELEYCQTVGVVFASSPEARESLRDIGQAECER